MSQPTKFSDLVTEAITNHGKATADIIGALGQGQPVDWPAETIKCFGQLTQTGARFLLFWDNIATLLAADSAGPMTFPGPKTCAQGEKQSFKLLLTGFNTATAQSGLRRRGENAFTIGAQAITTTVEVDGIALSVICSGAPRGVYEGTLALTDANGTQVARPYNVYIDPA
jgi:hypothetical protein